MSNVCPSEMHEDYLRGACAPNPATEPDTHTVKEGRDCTSLVLRLAGLRENARDNL